MKIQVLRSFEKMPRKSTFEIHEKKSLKNPFFEIRVPIEN